MSGSKIDWFQRALTCQGSLLGQHEQLIWVLVVNSAATAWSVSDLTQVSQLACSVPSSTPAAGSMTGAASLSAVMKDSHACDPEPFDDDLDKCRGSLFQCQLGVHDVLSRSPQTPRESII